MIKLDKFNLWVPVAVVIILAVLLAGCSTLGVSLTDRVVQSSSAIESAAETVLLRSQAEAITLQEAKSLQIIIHEADSFQDVAETALIAKDLPRAEQAVVFVNDILQAIERRLKP